MAIEIYLFILFSFFKVKELASRNNLKIHVDGARLFNAASVLSVPAAQVVQHADSVCFSLCKVCYFWEMWFWFLKGRLKRRGNYMRSHFQNYIKVGTDIGPSTSVKIWTRLSTVRNFYHNRGPKCDVIILQIFPFEPLNLIMRYAQQL